MATSITNTSVTTDDLTVDTSTLKVDATNNRVGIGTSTPLSTVHQDVGLTSRDGYKLFYGTDPKAAFTVLPNTGEIRIGAATVGTSGNYYTEIMSRNGSNLVTSIKGDNYGRVTKPNQPGFSVRQQAQGGIDCSSTDYIAFRHIHTTFFNTGNHFNSSTGMFTAPVAGNYVFGAAIRYDSFTGNYAYASIYKNSSTLYSRELTSLTGNYLHLSIHCIMNMSANDTCHVALRNSGDSSINLDSDSNFYGYLLG